MKKLRLLGTLETPALVVLSSLISVTGLHAGAYKFVPIVNGVCDPAHDDEAESVAPTRNLCFASLPSPVAGSGPWNWTCAGSNGGSTATCQTIPAAYATLAPSTDNSTNAFYVDPNIGSDGNNGLYPTQSSETNGPFLTLEKAQAAMRTAAGASPPTVGQTTYLMGGTFNRTRTLALTNADTGQTWIAYPWQTPILDGGSTGQGVGTNTAITMTAMKYARISGLIVQHYAQTGILTNAANYLVLTRNTIQYIYSNSQVLQGGIIENKTPNSKFTNNLIAYTNSIGLAMSFNGTSAGQENNLVFSNIMHDNNRYPFTDSGCFYVSDIYRANYSIGVVDNIFYNCVGQGIYSDDNSSYVTYADNIIWGSNIYCAFFVHGGDHNVFTNNICDVSNTSTAVFSYQDEYAQRHINFGMAANSVYSNIIYSRNNSPPLPVWITLAIDAVRPPVVSTNIYYAAAGMPFTNPDMYEGNGYSTFKVTDANAFFGNPRFSDPAANNYSLAGSYATTTIGFRNIDTSNIGP